MSPIRFLTTLLRGGALALAAIFSAIIQCHATTPSQLHVEGRFLVDESGNRVNLHGFGQTYSPWFNEQGSKWSDYNTAKCLEYNKGLIDDIIAAGWKFNFLRLHMDPYWSNKPGVNVKGENDISAFDMERFTRYLDYVFIPMAEYAAGKGLYVVMRPPGVCPENINVGGAYHNYLKQVWEYVARHEKLKNNPAIMFELANEPIKILGTDGVYGTSGEACQKNLTKFFQEIVDLMREQGCDNVLWVPGTGYQSQYAGFASHPVTGGNVGYAVHVYPGWYGSDAIEPSHELGGGYGGGYEAFRNGWEAQIKPAAEIAPIMVTEMDWAPSVYNASWGRSITGKFFGEGFGANFKELADQTGNVSWMIFTGPEILAKFKDTPGKAGNYTVLTDPEACIWPTYHWFKEYAGEKMPQPTQSEFRTSVAPTGTDEYTVLTGGCMSLGLIGSFEGYESNIAAEIEASVSNRCVEYAVNRLHAVEPGEAAVSLKVSHDGVSTEKRFKVISTQFPFVEGLFNPSIWETGSFDASSHTITTGPYGFAGWQYGGGLDLSGYNYLVAVMDGANNAGVSFRAFDQNNYWSNPAMASFDSKGVAVIDLRNMKSENGTRMDAGHIYIAGFWSLGGKPFKISKVYATRSDDPMIESGIDKILTDDVTVDVYSLQGLLLRKGVEREIATDGLPSGIYIVGGKKLLVK